MISNWPPFRVAMSALEEVTPKKKPSIETVEAELLVRSTSKLLAVEPAATSLSGDKETVRPSACAGGGAQTDSKIAADFELFREKNY